MATRTHKSQTSYTEDALKMTTYADDYITRGNAFQIKRRIKLTSEQTMYLEFDITKAVGKVIYSMPLQMVTSGGLVYVDTYTADSSTGGTSLGIPINLNGLSSNTALTTVKSGVTVSGDVTNLRQYVVGTHSSTGGGPGNVDVPKILNNAKPLYFKLVNAESDSTVLEINFVWFEI